MLTPLWENVYEMISNNLHMFTIPVNTLLESPTGDLKNVEISVGVCLLEK